MRWASLGASRRGTPMGTPMGEPAVALLVFGDGPCHSSSFRPNDDETQWWARRDALVRIVRAACCHGWRRPHRSVHSLQMIFHSVVEKPSSTEADRKDEIGLSSIIPSTLLSTMAMPYEQGLIRAWRSSFQDAEAALHGKARGADRSQCIQSFIFPRETSTSKEVGAGEADYLSKKDMVLAMQRGASLEFLRRHHLNGSAELVLKKANKAALLTAFAEFTSQAHILGSGTNPLDRCIEQALANVLDLPQASGQKRKCEGGQRSAALVFFHEDYPHELPLFPGGSESSEFDIVICVLGGVRDISRDEVRALLRAATARGVVCLGANLGRTAEFTSKIVTSLVYHATRGVLLPAATKLRAMTSSSAVEELLRHQASTRVGGKTWDGQHSKSVAGLAVLTPAMEDSRLNSGDFVIMLCQLSCRVDEVSVEASERERWIGLVQLAVSTLWRSRMASDLQDGDDGAGHRGVATALVLGFACGAVASVTQRRVSEEIAAHHIAAPSEHQVLAMLRRLFTDPACVVEGRSMEDAVYELRDGLSLGDVDEVHALTPTACQDVLTGTAQAAAEGAIDLAKQVYSSTCSCALAERGEGRTRVLFVSLGVEVPTLLRMMYYWKYDKGIKGLESKKEGKRLEKLQKKHLVVSLGLGMSAADCATILQHWSYHDRLFSALRDL